MSKIPGCAFRPGRRADIVHHMQLRRATFLALVTVLGLAAAGCGASGPALDSVDSLAGALDALGAAVESAPPEAVTQAGAVFCGVEDVRPFESDGTNPIGDPAGRQCFVEAVAAGTDAVFVRSQPTVEGDPVVEVFRTSGGQVTLYIDATRDAFGSGRWETVPCSGLRFQTQVSADFFTCG